MNKQKYPDSSTVAIQKRLSTVFKNCQFVLVWANSKPIDRALIHQLDQKVASAFGMCNIDPLDFAFYRRVNDKKNAVEAINLKVADKNSILNHVKLSKMANVSKVSFPKDALNNHCLNISLPMVGCGVDLLVLKKNFLLLTAAQKQFVRDSQTSGAEKLAKTNAVQTQLGLKDKATTHVVTQEAVLPLIFALTEQDPGNSLNLEKLLKTHQVAIFINHILETRNFESKWHSNQLLGAFIKKANDSVVYVSSAELKQSILLQQASKGIPPKQIAKQPFVKTITQIKETYSGQAKSISKLVKNLIYIINRSKTKLVSNISFGLSQKSS
uniref:Uncharacterized protein n=1 Tax=Tupiella akineta TaxID=160070 RepID=Q6UVT7_TUPAK|nr:hypothetical protein PsakpMp25 [Tupiella akineta]AAQ18737.1 hypothetical protein [Tupiella akineta]